MTVLSEDVRGEGGCEGVREEVGKRDVFASDIKIRDKHKLLKFFWYHSSPTGFFFVKRASFIGNPGFSSIFLFFFARSHFLESLCPPVSS